MSLVVEPVSTSLVKLKVIVLWVPLVECAVVVNVPGSVIVVAELTDPSSSNSVNIPKIGFIASLHRPKRSVDSVFFLG